MKSSPAKLRCNRARRIPPARMAHRKTAEQLECVHCVCVAALGGARRDALWKVVVRSSANNEQSIAEGTGYAERTATELNITRSSCSLFGEQRTGRLFRAV